MLADKIYASWSSKYSSRFSKPLVVRKQHRLVLYLHPLHRKDFRDSKPPSSYNPWAYSSRSTSSGFSPSTRKLAAHPVATVATAVKIRASAVQLHWK